MLMNYRKLSFFIKTSMIDFTVRYDVSSISLKFIIIPYIVIFSMSNISFLYHIHGNRI